MRILFTGASSFTGHWFARQLAEAGHQVTSTFTHGTHDQYNDVIRRLRVSRVLECCTPLFGCRFGDERFLDELGQGDYDVLCHHAALVGDYKSGDFDVGTALAANTHCLPRVLESLRKRGGTRIVVTGSVFEGGEGAGSDGLPHFSPYGLSKALTAETFRFYCRAVGMPLAKFVIPNPFGPFEEPRFTAYLMRTWFAAQTASVRTPLYVRDNIHVSLLARAYVAFIEKFEDSGGFRKTNPSGYVESQGAFAHRFAVAMRERLGLTCNLDLAEQHELLEPRVRINTDTLSAEALGWDEAAAWDELAEYYERQLRPSASV